MNQASTDDLQTRILDMLDGMLTKEELIRLDEELRGSREAREIFHQLSTLHSALESQGMSHSETGRMPIIPVQLLLARQRRQTVRTTLLATAAVLVFSLFALWLKMAPHSQAALAEFRLAPDSAFTLIHTGEDDASLGNVLSEGSRLRLSRGTMEGLFASGVRCVIEAPCDLSVLSKNRISVAEGVAWFEVPHEAAGFTVETSQLTVVDLGTKFGVVAEAKGRHEVHVTKGSVEVGARQSAGAVQILKAGHALGVDSIGKLHGIDFNGDRFTTALPGPIVIKNPDFDIEDTDSGIHDSDGYGPITFWATSGAGVGVSGQSQPFLNQNAHSGGLAAFIQGKGIISQSVSGFDPTKLYTVTYFVSERGLPGAVTSTSVSLDLGTSSYAPPGSIRKTDAFRRIVSGPLAVFGPTANVGISAATVSGDASLLVDSVSITRAVPSVADGGFENPVQPGSAFKQATGTGAGELDGTAWSFFGGGGITAKGSSFLPPLAPEGSQAAILQNVNARFSGTVSGFEPGVTYSLSLDAAGRKGGAADFQVRLGGKILRFEGSDTLSPSGSGYVNYTSDKFTTRGESLPLSFEATGKGTSFIDDIRFNFVAEAPN